MHPIRDDESRYVDGKIMANKIALFVMLYLVSSVSLALQSSGTVKAFYVSESGRALVKLSTENSDCGNATWTYTFSSASSDLKANTVANQWSSMFLAARMSSSKISIGYEAATPEGSYCKLTYVYFY